MSKYDNVNWERYHELLDIKMDRGFTKAEWREYKTYLPIVARFDAEEAARCKPIIDGLVRKHERHLKFLDKLIDDLGDVKKAL